MRLSIKILKIFCSRLTWACYIPTRDIYESMCPFIRYSWFLTISINIACLTCMGCLLFLDLAHSGLFPTPNHVIQTREREREIFIWSYFLYQYLEGISPSRLSFTRLSLREQRQCRLGTQWMANQPGLMMAAAPPTDMAIDGIFLPSKRNDRLSHPMNKPLE